MIFLEWLGLLLIGAVVVGVVISWVHAIGQDVEDREPEIEEKPKTYWSRLDGVTLAPGEEVHLRVRFGPYDQENES